jgi:FSR family fosmidomycin resistance protein-like MFS transporter
VQGTALNILFALSFSHLLNDTVQALIPALYPLLKESFGLTFSQIGMITLTFQLTGAVFQPFIGFYTDRKPQPYSLAVAMGISLVGLVLLATAHGYGSILTAAAMIGLGSAVFHPESSRMARLASGGRHGFAQSLFQMGGCAGSASGPLLVAWIIVPHGQSYVLVFTLAAFAGIVLLSGVGKWYARMLLQRPHHRQLGAGVRQRFRPGTIALSVTVLFILMFSKFFYLVSLTNYYTFYLIQRFGVTVPHAQYCLFLFLGAVAVGTLVGGFFGDRFGRKTVIWFSILGTAPFALVLPYANLYETAILSVFIGFILASAFPAILVYATELMPGSVGLMAGTFFGLAFGLGGIGSAVLGRLADVTSVPFVMSVCAFLPLLGFLTFCLPDVSPRSGR